MAYFGGVNGQQTPADREEGGCRERWYEAGKRLGVAPRTHDEIKPPRAGFDKVIL
jgi:hypothetical protein